MKYSVRSYFGILLALTFALSSCKKDEITARDISVLNYNIAGLPQVLSSSNPELYTSHISRLLNEYSIVHVQEDFCYHDSLLLFDNHPYRTESTGSKMARSLALNTSFCMWPFALDSLLASVVLRLSIGLCSARTAAWDACEPYPTVHKVLSNLYCRLAGLQLS